MYMYSTLETLVYQLYPNYMPMAPCRWPEISPIPQGSKYIAHSLALSGTVSSFAGGKKKKKVYLGAQCFCSWTRPLFATAAALAAWLPYPPNLP